MNAAAFVLAETVYGDCPECGQPLTDPDTLHTWADGVSDCHADCCPECNATVHCTRCLNHYPAAEAHTCWGEE